MFMAMIVMLACFAMPEVAFAGTKDKNTEDIVGAPTQKTWTFMAEKSGTYQIVFTCARPWEKTSSYTQTATYTIKVSDEKNTDSTVMTLVADKENAVKLGQKFAVTLEENGSTGYGWSYDIKDNGINFITSETQPLLGAPTNKEWTFKASKKGTYNLVFTYARSWEKKSADTKTVVYKIKVVNKKAKNSDAVGLVEGKVNTIYKNQKFFITLEENASTGYSWSYKASAKTIKLIKEDTIDLVGAPTQALWTFEAKKSGTYKLVFTYARSWEKNSSDANVVEYTVKVTDEKGTDESSVALVEGKENTVKLGEKFYISLEENASTGYSWSYSIEGNVISLAE